MCQIKNPYKKDAFLASSFHKQYRKKYLRRKLLHFVGSLQKYIIRNNDASFG
jgi:hypothetical protein